MFGENSLPVFGCLIFVTAVQVFQQSTASEIHPLSIGENKTTYFITKTWDSQDANANISITFSTTEQSNKTYLFIEVEAPYYNNPEGPDPEVNSTADPYVGLWDHEVVEAFFLGTNEEYLEIELAPTGHYLLYYLTGVRNVTNGTLRIEPPEVSIQNDTSSPTGEKWVGSAYVPLEYFPCSVIKFNAYAIHIKSENENRTYMSLFPAAEGQYENPDYHRLELFGDVTFDEEPNQEPRCTASAGITTSVSVSLSIVSFLTLTLSWLKVE